MKRTYLIIAITVAVYVCTKCFYSNGMVAVSKELTLKDVSVVIDPGHGGLDNGASVGKIYESELNLKISFALKDELESIHLNSAPASSAWGSQVFYYKNSDKGKRLAEEIQSTMKEITGSPKRISGSSFRVLRATQTVGVLIECGFISNANERGQLQSSKYHQKLAVKICDGLENYREKYPEDTIKKEDFEKILN